MKTIVFKEEQILKVFGEAEDVLFDETAITNIIYKNKSVASFDEHNSDFLKKVAGKSIVYCIWLGNTKQSLKPKYVGHVKETITRQRMRAHLTKKNKATGSQLAKVILAVEQGYSIGMTVVIIQPPYMRKALEDWLIAKHSKMLVWNEIGRSKAKLPGEK